MLWLIVLMAGYCSALLDEEIAMFVPNTEHTERITGATPHVSFKMYKSRVAFVTI